LAGGASDSTEQISMLTPGGVLMTKGGAGSSQKKIEEDYSMFEEVKDDELEDIIEEDIEDESDENN
jgi:hypothetical protein